ncbi:angiopoietin-related protein 3-like [Phyllostomus discolor]|uniref:Angiopoietin-related protein 3-like n=1 Tax=Phyllostomus discolor TaxID=89673 RepID=A0A7E6DF29_9CHIR|nr:angiopoietin-related protein 3-like [Phyllostomus discolor]
MQKAPVWFLLSLAYSLSSARKQRECHAPVTHSQDDINILSQGLLQLGMELKMQASYNKNHNGHLVKQLDTLNTSLAELLTQVSQQERKGEDLERRAEQLDKRNEGLCQLVTELQHQLAAGIQYREKFSERLELLERKMEDAVLFKADGLSLTQVMDDIMPSVQRQNQRIDELFAEVKMQQNQLHKRDTLIKKLREKVKSKHKSTKESVKTGNEKKSLDV